MESMEQIGEQEPRPQVETMEAPNGNIALTGAEISVEDVSVFPSKEQFWGD